MGNYNPPPICLAADAVALVSFEDLLRSCWTLQPLYGRVLFTSYDVRTEF